MGGKGFQRRAVKEARRAGDARRAKRVAEQVKIIQIMQAPAPAALALLIAVLTLTGTGMHAHAHIHIWGFRKSCSPRLQLPVHVTCRRGAGRCHCCGWPRAASR